MMLGIDETINGVNLGNWLVLEKWIDPTLFAESGEADEIWMHRTMPPERLAAVLKAHRDTYITVDDFKAIAAHGCNLVRLPVPYFVFGDLPRHPGCIEYVDKAFAWANATGLKVMLDLHTVPGSQNGFDNGGLTGVCKWSRNPDAVQYALNVLVRLAERYRDDPALFGIEVLNEPVSWSVFRSSPSSKQAKDSKEAADSGYVPMRFLKRFYREAYARLRAVLNPETFIVFHDGFRLNRWGCWFRRAGMRNVMLDTHIYLIAIDDTWPFRVLPFKPLQRYRFVVALRGLAIRLAARHIPVMVGEWCVENRWALRLGQAAHSSQEQAEAKRMAYRAVSRLQLAAWNMSAGQVYWSYQLCHASGGAPCNCCGDGGFEAWDLTRVWRNGWLG